MNIREIAETECTFEVSTEPDDQPIRGSVDDSLVEQIERELESNPWAWCTIKVEAKWNGITGVAHLGGCSYTSFEDFTKDTAYFDQMRADAVADLNETLQMLADRITPLMS
jgi:hypothetical protein